MRSKWVVIVRVVAQEPPQEPFVEHDDVVQALAADRPDKSFNVAILPGRARRRWAIPDPHRSEPFAEGFAKGAVAISDVNRRRTLTPDRRAILPPFLLFCGLSR